MINIPTDVVNTFDAIKMQSDPENLGIIWDAISARGIHAYNWITKLCV